MSAPSSDQLFSVPILPSGTIVCTQPAPKVYLLTFSNPPDNRLTPAFCAAFILALDLVEHTLPKGVVITTSAITKFYSNGLDLESAISTPGFWKNSLYALFKRLLIFPMPTIALLNGHAFAGGLMTALMHDYRIMNPHRGYLCMNEVEFGAPLRPAMAAVFRDKLPRPDLFRTVLLEAKRFNALEALKEGLVDGLGGLTETLAFVTETKLMGKADSGVYGKLKEEMWRHTLKLLERGGSAEDKEVAVRDQSGQKESEDALRRIKEWKAKSRGASKL